MKPITACQRAGVVEVDVTCAAEGMLDRLADAWLDQPDLIEDLVIRLGSALRFREAAAADGDQQHAALAASQAKECREELVGHMAAVRPEGLELVTVHLPRPDALDLTEELTRAAGPAPGQRIRGAA
ncbi:hypothetical protein ACWDSL_41000 [Streptomyces sp. NPDC000941]